VASNAGFAGDDLVTAVAVALAESSGNPQALGDIGIGQGSFGLWQISSKYHPEYGPNFAALYDPQANANAAFAIYSAAGNSFSPWSTFKTGSYAEFLDSVSAAIAVASAAVVTAVSENPETSAGLLVAVLIIGFLLLRRG
jgi:alpha-L-arabinofuranosidase